MKNYFSLFVFVAALAFVSCEPKPEPKPQPIDGMRHDSLTATYDLFCNPERGFHVFKDFHSPTPKELTPAGIKTIYEMGYTLVLTNYYLEEYRDKPIAESYLDVVRNNMQAIREGGCKCVLRFAYTSSESQYPQDAPLDTVLLHISQIKPILQEYADVIFAMEAGFVGVWGEWYYTTYFKNQPSLDEDFIPRRKVLDALLDALPAERMICVRTPQFKMRCYGWGLADTLTRAEAFSGTPKSRLACHDDAFMASESDMGTFNNDTQRAYWSAETRYTIYGGESCRPGNYANCDNSIAQMKDMHISYLNINYHGSVIAGWQKSGCLEDMRRLIGYRLVGTDVATTESPKVGEKLEVVLTLVNEGFSSPKNPRDVRMLLISKSDPKNIISVTPDCEPRFWGPEGEHKISVAFRPEKAGEYDICLYLPDPMPTLANDPRYAIRLANKDCWDAETGYNYLTTVTVEN